jgi:hypothetical protein
MKTVSARGVKKAAYDFALYLTQMVDTNGNQVTLTYMQGIGAPFGASSGRLLTIEDVRATTSGQNNPWVTLHFTYNNDAVPHRRM